MVSSNNQVEQDFFEEITTKGLRKFGLNPKLGKFHRSHTSVRQKALGIIVNKKTNIPKEEVHELDVILHNAASTGIESQNRKNHPSFPAHIAGRIAQVKAINPELGEKLWRKFKEVIPEF